MSNSGTHIEPQAEPFIWTKGEDSSNSINPDRVQESSYSEYSLLVLPVVGIEPATPGWFHLEVPSN